MTLDVMIMIIKTTHVQLPKKWLDETMMNTSGRILIRLKGTTEELKQKWVCIGYTYTKQTVLTIILIHGVGSSEPWDSYKARFPDKYGNLCVRHIAGPQVNAKYFKYINKVYVHNQARKFDIGLEKQWVIPSTYFRVYTSQVGMNLTDSWKVIK